MAATAYGAKARVSILFWGDSRSEFSGRPDSMCDGKEVAVTGLVEDYRGTTQVVINTPSAMENCD